MKGLILKDLLVLRKQWKIFALFIVLFAVIPIYGDDTSFYQGFIVVLGGMMPITALSYDERAHWDKYALTMPVTRRTMVLGKYLLGLIMISAAILVGALSIVLSCAIKRQPLPEGYLLIELVFLAVGLVFLSLTLPMILKFGTEKGRLVFLLVAVVIMLLPTLADQMGAGAAGGTPGFLSVGILSLVPVALLVFLPISVLLSVRIYGKKELT